VYVSIVPDPNDERALAEERAQAEIQATATTTVSVQPEAGVRWVLAHLTEASGVPARYWQERRS